MSRMSTITVKHTLPVTVIKCQSGGYAWAVKDLHLIGESNTIDDIHADVVKDIDEILNVLAKEFTPQPKDL